jgi:pyruvate dehydrogenase E1 component
VATTDYVKLVAEQIANFVNRPFLALGTDGFGRSDTREALRRFFEVDMANVVVGALAELVRTGEAKPEELHDAIAHYGVRLERFDPTV